MFASRFNGNNCFQNGDMMPGVNWWDGSAPGLIPNGMASGAAYYAPDGNGNPYLVNLNNRFGAVAAPYANQSRFQKSIRWPFG